MEPPWSATVLLFAAMSLDIVGRLPWDGDTAARRRARVAYRKAAAARMVPRIVWTCAILTPVAGAAAAVGRIAASREPEEAAATALLCTIWLLPYVPVARALGKLMR